ncbi:hypothetical protein M378DRAFT_15079 [Amanita muscaria Koide BX008]|uniref:Uncharacterized protein n=1 Tax=Amanita muscaria (strain Koide BX008) TaxID=946122 RepID=A0A0C2WRY0_AMAMK|nr:hypothetical protein M378DRAFT_15079 [Amanita muscaria Koide BX008]
MDISYFTPNLIALSPPALVLNYVRNYLIDTPTANQIPLNQVFDLLCLAMTRDNVTLPDPTLIVGLFMIVPLMPRDRTISKNHLPKLSHLQNNHFSPVPHGTSPAVADQNVARIFDVAAAAALLASGRYKIPEIKTFSADDGLISVRPVGGGGSGGCPSGGGGGGDEPSGNEGTRGRGGSSALKRSLRSSDHAKPPSRKGRTNMCLSKVVGELDISKSRSGGPDEFQLSYRSLSPERMHHGLNPNG